MTATLATKKGTPVRVRGECPTCLGWGEVIPEGETKLSPCPARCEKGRIVFVRPLK